MNWWAKHIEDEIFKLLAAEYKRPVVTPELFERLRAAAEHHHFDFNPSLYDVADVAIVEPVTTVIHTEDGEILWKRGQ